MTETTITRRKFITYGIGIAGLAGSLASPALASAMPRYTRGASMRILSFHNLHTDERLQTVYWKDGQYDRKAWYQINHLMRDHRSGQSHVMDLRLIDLLHDVQAHLQNDRTIEIISGYRSPSSNQYLRENTNGVAKNSFHLRGMAADIRIDGAPLPVLHQVALNMDRGGVGYYPDSEFVHLDVGPKDRVWSS